jgi:hypothetical protein
VLISTRHAAPQAGAFEITGASLSISGRDAGNYETPEGIAHNSRYKTGNVSGDFAYALAP